MTEREQFTAFMAELIDCISAGNNAGAWLGMALARFAARTQSSPTSGKVTATKEGINAALKEWRTLWNGGAVHLLTMETAMAASLNAALAVMFPDQSKGGE